MGHRGSPSRWLPVFFAIDIGRGVEILDVTTEIVDYVDADDRFVRCGPRSGAMADGLYYRVAATVVRSGDGRVLVYRRSSGATVFPGYHDVLIGGGVRTGESYRQAAERELAEEIGLKTTVSEIHRIRHDSPVGPCHLVVHVAVFNTVLRPAAGEIDWHGLLPVAQVLADPPQPFIQAGLDALRRLIG
jgi:8-oxo-dGTP pyrophosphatase MutT (NUDIX family)